MNNPNKKNEKLHHNHISLIKTRMKTQIYLLGKYNRLMNWVVGLTVCELVYFL